MSERGGGTTSSAVHRQALWITLTSVAGLTIGYVAAVFIARVLGPTDRGLFQVLQTVALVSTVVIGFSAQYGAQYYASRRRQRTGPLLANGLALCVVLAVALVGGALVLRGPIERHVQPGYDSRLWIVTAALIPVLLFGYWTMSLLLARQDFRRYNLLNLGERVGWLGAAALFVVVFDWGVGGALAAMAVGSLIASVGSIRSLATRAMRPSRVLFAACFRYGLRVQVGKLIALANGRLDILILSAFAPLAEVAYYGIAQTVAELVLLIPSAVGTALMPAVAASRGTDRLSAPSMRLNGSLTVLAVLGVAIAGPAVILVGFGGDYRPAIAPFLLLLPGMVFLSSGEVIGDVLRGRGRPGTASLLGALALTITIALDLLLIPPYHAIGGAIASTCAYVVFGIASILVVARSDGVPAQSLLFATRGELRAVWSAVRARFRRRER